jgi:hypothetical protein
MRCLIFLRLFACWFLILFFSATVAFAGGIIWRIVSAFSCIIADVARIMSDWATSAPGTAANLASVSSTDRFKNLHFPADRVSRLCCG